VFVGFYRAAVADLSPGLQPISANLIVIAQRLIGPKGLMRVARLRKAYVATEEDGCAKSLRDKEDKPRLS
jgi:hypothetical protein